MAPRIPFEGEPKPVSGEAKFMAAIFAVVILLLSAIAILMGYAIVIGLWRAGLVSSLILIAIFTGLFGIIRKLYRYILEKDLL